MEKIASFTVNHDKLKKGMYISRIDGDIVTYDIRMRIPNNGSYLENNAMHTFEHLFATYARNTNISDGVIYVGPMGCRTGFYLLVRDTIISHEDALNLVKDAFSFIAEYEGEVPGTDPVECGNYEEHNLSGAKEDASDMVEILKNWTVEKMKYEE